MPARTYRVAVVGASSLRGKDLAELMAERSFPSRDLHLIDDGVVSGTLTEAAGEPAFIQAMAEDSFEGVEIAFFAGRPEFTIKHWQQAARAGAIVVDLSGAFVDVPESQPWIPALDGILPPRAEAMRGRVFFSPPTATLVASTLAAAFVALKPRRLAVVFLQPVSERGAAGIEELESQTVNLLSFQPISQAVYDAQVAFNLLARYGTECREHLEGAQAAISRGVSRVLEATETSRQAVPAIQLVQVPVFYSYGFTVFAEFPVGLDAAGIEKALVAAGVRVQASGETSPSNVSVAGESCIHVAHVEADTSVSQGWWLWGAADNVRLAAANALQIAEKLIGS